VDEQVRRLEERRHVSLDELLDRDPPVAQDPLFAVDEGDLGLAGPGVRVAVVEGHEPGLVAELRDVESELAFGAPYDGEFRLGVQVAQVRGRFGHSGLLRCAYGSVLRPAYPSPRVGS